MVDDKARRVLRLHRLVAPLAHGLGQGGANGGVGFQTSNHLHHFHQRHGVEEMQTGKALGALQAGGNLRHRQRRGVAHQHRIGRHHGLQLGKHGLLHVQTLHNGFHHQGAVFQRSHLGHRLQTGAPGLQLLFADAALGLQALPLLLHGSAGGVGGATLGIKQQYLAATLSGNLGNAPAHGTSANKAHERVNGCGHKKIFQQKVPVQQHAPMGWVQRANLPSLPSMSKSTNLPELCRVGDNSTG